MKRYRAFTLIELVVVIAVTGALAVAILPRFANQTDFNQAGFRDQLASSLQYARKIAIASRRYVCADVAGATVSLSVDPRSPEAVAAVNCTVALRLPAGSTASLTAPTGVALGGTTAVRFDPLGQSVSAPGTAAAASLTLTGVAAITVEQTGYVH